MEQRLFGSGKEDYSKVYTIYFPKLVRFSERRCGEHSTGYISLFVGKPGTDTFTWEYECVPFYRCKEPLHRFPSQTNPGRKTKTVAIGTGRKGTAI